MFSVSNDFIALSRTAQLERAEATAYKFLGRNSGSWSEVVILLTINLPILTNASQVFHENFPCLT